MLDKDRDLKIAESVLAACVSFLRDHALEQAINVSKEYAQVTKGNAELLDSCIGMKLQDILERV